VRTKRLRDLSVQVTIEVCTCYFADAMHVLFDLAHHSNADNKSGAADRRFCRIFGSTQLQLRALKREQQSAKTSRRIGDCSIFADFFLNSTQGTKA
jgi:hypothetical protein